MANSGSKEAVAERLITEGSRKAEGRCLDPLCPFPDDKGPIYLFRGLWRCDGCIEEMRDADESYRENRADMLGL